MEIVAALHYEKIRRIGIGQGMNSEVFLGSDPQLNGAMAVKEIPKSSFGNNPAVYFAEAQTMFAVAHPNVVPIQYGCQTHTHVVLAMPYFSRGSLTDRIGGGSVSLIETLRIAQGILSGLARIHSKGFLHLDIKPSNVLFTADDIPMLADFGQSRLVGSGGVVQMPQMYSLGIPPETWRYGTASQQSDIYQVGLLLYRTMNSNLVFESQTPADPDLEPAVIAGKFPNRDFFLPHVPKRLRTLIRKALKVDPAERYHSALEMADALATVKINLNWNASFRPLDVIEWRVPRAGKPDLVVELSPQNAHWATKVSTVSNGVRRARGLSTFCRDGLTRTAALTHLKSVFEELSA